MTTDAAPSGEKAMLTDEQAGQHMRSLAIQVCASLWGRRITGMSASEKLAWDLARAVVKETCKEVIHQC